MNLNKELIVYFVEHLRKQGIKKEATIQNIERDLLRFIERLAEGEINSESVKSYIEDLEKEYRESSYLSKLSSIRQFVKWLNLKENPFWQHKTRIQGDYKVFYDMDEVFTKVKDDLDFLLISFVYEFYLSVDELLGLNVGDYNLAGGELEIRGVGISADESLRYIVKEYLQQKRPSFNINAPLTMADPFFVNSKNERLSHVELRKRISAYGLRPLYVKKSRIVNLLDEGLSFEEIEEKLGVKLNNVYSPFLKKPEYRLLKAYQECHPRAGM